MPNCESNRNGWKDGKSKCNCCDKKEDLCCCESKDSHCENDKHEHDCHKKEHEHDCHKKDDCGCESKHDQCKDHKKDDCDCESKHNQCKDDKHEHDCHKHEHEHEHDCHKKDCKDKEHECNHHDKKEECCCKESMREALELLLFNDKIKKCVKFDEFAFIGQKFVVGAHIEKGKLRNLNNDNISSPNAKFNGFEACNCDLIKLFAEHIFYPIPCEFDHHGDGDGHGHGHDDDIDCDDVKLEGFGDIKSESLCDVEAVAFNFHHTCHHFEEDLAKFLDEFNKKCNVKCDKCCCNEGLFNKIFNPCNPNNTVTLTAGWLAVKDAKVLGKIGNVLVLSSTATQRIYFVCLDSIGFIGDIR